MRLIGLPVILAVSLPLAPVAVEAQQAERVYRIGLLSASSESAAAGVEATVEVCEPSAMSKAATS